MAKRETAPNGAPCWVELYTSDPDKARPFYEGLFGWTSESAGDEYGGYVNFSKDGVLVAGCMRNDGAGGMPDVWSVYLATDDIKATADAAASNGGQVVVEPMAVMELGSMAVFTDAGQAAIGAWQPGLHKGFGVLGEPGTPTWFELFTRDYDASVRWYQTVFGWDTKAEGDSPEFRYTTLQAGGEQQAGIMDASSFLPDGVPAHWSVYFGAADTDATIAQLVERGGTVVTPAEDTPYGRIAVVADPIGTQFKLVGPSA